MAKARKFVVRVSFLVECADGIPRTNREAEVELFTIIHGALLDQQSGNDCWRPVGDDGALTVEAEGTNSK